MVVGFFFVERMRMIVKAMIACMIVVVGQPGALVIMLMLVIV